MLHGSGKKLRFCAFLTLSFLGNVEILDVALFYPLVILFPLESHGIFWNFILLGFQCSLKSVDQIELLREQQKILAGKVALQTSAMKRLNEEAAKTPQKELIQVSPRIKF